MTDFERKFEEEFEKQKQETQKPNLIVVGGTGVGKSSLINRIFGCDIAKTGEGKPITSGIDRYEPQNIPLVFFDTEGYEVAKDGTQNRTDFETKIIPEIEKMNKGELKDQIHLVWYCISITNHRVTEYDKLNIKYFVSRKMKTAIVFTQCDNDEELPDGKGKDAVAIKAEIEKSISGLSFFETCATKKEHSLDLEALIEWSGNALPNDQLRQSFIASQKVSIKRKKENAYILATTFAATAAATAGLNPLPVSDSILIVPQQLAMAMAISKIFFFDSAFEAAGAFLKSQIISLAGKQIAASLLKLIPVVGQIVNAGVAGAITFGLGAGLIEAYAHAYDEFLNTGKLPDWTSVFSSSEFVNNVAGAFDSWKNKGDKI
jgi:uncharacterized protein (DUF697 family)/GTP-binding protein EngB required for normal cell division